MTIIPWEYESSSNAKGMVGMVGMVGMAGIEGLDGVVRILQSLGGHIRGEYVVHSLLKNQSEFVSTVNCSLPIATMMYAPTVLTSVGYTLTNESSETTPQYDIERHYTVKGICKLIISPFFKAQHSNQEPSSLHFDWDMVTLSRDRLTVRKYAKFSGDLMASVITRIIGSKFCISPLASDAYASDDAIEKGSDDSKLAKHDANAMKRADRLVEIGWMMDDWLDGPNSWVVSRWKDLSGARKLPHSSVIKTHSNCPLCYERFADNEIVVNLPCNHNFHVHCHQKESTSYEDPNDSTNSGLCAWLSNGHTSCPCCRSQIRVKPKH